MTAPAILNTLDCPGLLAVFLGHSLWIGLLAAMLYQCLATALPKLPAAARSWSGLALLAAIPSASLWITFRGLPRLSLPEMFSVEASRSLISGAVFLWLAGLTVYWLRLLSGQQKLARQLQNDSLVHRQKNWLDLIDDCRSRFGIRGKNPAVLTNLWIRGPLLTGLCRPKIVVPERLTRSDARCAAAVLNHELAHFRRGDVWILLLQTTVKSVFFFNPWVSWISNQIHSERERACDDLALKMGNESRLEYAAALLEAETISSIRSPSLTIGFGGESTAERALRIAFGEKTPSPLNTATGSILLILLTSLTALAIWAGLSVFSITTDWDNSPEIVAPTTHLPDPIPTPPPEIDLEDLAATRGHWRNRTAQGQTLALFKSVPLIEKNGVVYNLAKDNPRLFPEIPNRWLLDHSVDFLDHRMPQRDPDRDRFSNLEEYRFGTKPDDPNSHPHPVYLLSYEGMRFEVYRTRYSAAPDNRTIQLTRLQSSNHHSFATELLRAGEQTGDGRIVLRKINADASEIEIEDLQSGEAKTLRKKEVAEFRTQFAIFRTRSGDSLEPQLGAPFFLAGDEPKSRWTVDRLDENNCKLSRSGSAGQPSAIEISKSR